MDLSCIISSGDLELYVLGALPPEEAEKIAALAQLFPEIRAELDAISLSLQHLAESGPKPPPALRNAVLDKLKALSDEESRYEPSSNGNLHRAIPLPLPETTETRLQSESSLRPGGRVMELPPRNNRHIYTAAASVIALLICGAALIWALNQRRELNNNLTAASGQMAEMKARVDAQSRTLSDYQTTLGIMQDPSYRTIRLAAVPNAPANAAAAVMWNPATSDMYVANLSLPEPPADKQYQLWAIVDGKPVDAGMMDGTKGMARKMKPFQKAEAFAITLEKKGGNPTPTMEAMYVMGKA